MKRATAYKAIELDPATRQRLGREIALEAQTRQRAVDELLEQLGVTAADARIDPTRTLVQLRSQLWTIVGVAPSALPADEPGSALRRAGAKHRRVR